jgi:hypothetical protein
VTEKVYDPGAPLTETASTSERLSIGDTVETNSAETTGAAGTEFPDVATV